MHTVTYPEGTSSTYNYDEISRLVSAANQNGTVSFVYDNRSQGVSTTDVLGKTITYTYDANGNRKTMASGTSLSVTYDTYDKANRLRQLTDTGGRVFNFDYNAVNQISTVTRSSGLVSTYTYDGMNRLKGLTQATLPSHFDFSYNYDQAGNIHQIISSADTRTYTYDQVNRLTDVSNSSGANETYRYDAVGNRTSSHLSSSYTLHSNNRVTATATATYGYDANGNMTSRTDAAGRWYFTWDGENRLVRVLKPGMRPASARTINYLYDALGRRIERSSRGGGSQSYTYDGHDTVLDQNSDGTQTAYANGPGIDNKLSQVRDGNHGNFLQDHLGSTVALTDTSGHDPDTIRYDSFGRPSNGFNSRFTYTGRETDPDTGLMYYRARWYDPTLGRFIGEDPIGFAGGDINLYGYVWNNPITFSDPLGLSGWGNDLADSLDADIRLAQDWYRYSDQEWVANGMNDSVAAMAYGFTDLLRVGSGVSHAFDDGVDGWEATRSVGHDVLRAVGLFTLFYGPAAGAAGRLGGGARTCAAKSELVNLASPQRTVHILKGDATGGGHLFPGAAGKTPFPKSWSGPKIMHEVSDVATDPSIPWFQQSGKAGSLFTKKARQADLRRRGLGMA